MECLLRSIAGTTLPSSLKTITLQIGNSDDKLSQEEWSSFHAAINTVVSELALRIHFAGTAPAAAPRQNACWVFEIEDSSGLRSRVTRIREDFRQRSAAWTEGETDFI